ncbi:hypothetical protein [Thiothrix subterranea]|uniref:Uncharacterized protein n=1 Tax=Thiothrix subterranea TaxID=2735563 RepID=A0AA51MKR1_9GAMM|nr:hypothetical protein [Thiothrix subterranea]MDQ5770978.1 hypothetical protein [Thiothrix subterranea]WML85983.1 hypothetical protein RCG00_16985 [Thiothrix subterranea]
MSIKSITERLNAIEQARQPPAPPFYSDYEAGWRRTRRYRKVFAMLYQNEGIEGFERRHSESLAKGKHVRTGKRRENGERHTVYSDYLIKIMMGIEAEKVAESLKGRGERIWAEILSEREARGAFPKTTP